MVEPTYFSREEVVELETLIQEHAGTLLPYQSKGGKDLIIVKGDGDPETKFFYDYSEGRLVVSDRYIYKCLEKKQVINLRKARAINLLALKFKVPHPFFQKLGLNFTCFDARDKITMTKVAELLGATTALKDGVTTHIIVNDDPLHSMDKSKTLQIAR